MVTIAGYVFKKRETVTSKLLWSRLRYMVVEHLGDTHYLKKIKEHVHIWLCMVVEVGELGCLA